MKKRSILSIAAIALAAFGCGSPEPGDGHGQSSLAGQPCSPIPDLQENVCSNAIDGTACVALEGVLVEWFPSEGCKTIVHGSQENPWLMECMQTNPVPEDYVTTYPEHGRSALERVRKDGVMEVLELPHNWPHRYETIRAMLGSDWDYYHPSDGVVEVYFAPKCE